MCEIFNQLKMMGFTRVKRCVYESRCPFDQVAVIEEVDVATQCQAARDEQNADFLEIKDLEQEEILQTLEHLQYAKN